MTQRTNEVLQTIFTGWSIGIVIYVLIIVMGAR